MRTHIPVASKAKLDEVTYTRLDRDWFGETSVGSPQFHFSLTKEHLWFGFRVSEAPVYNDELSSGDFVEGLWEQDVCEFFVGGVGSHYLEFNVSPQGAWWAASFSDYRKRDREFEEARVQVHSRLGENSWETRFAVALADLEPWASLALEDYRLSVTSISHAGGVRYHCFGHETGGEPDFHLSENRRPIVIV